MPKSSEVAIESPEVRTLGEVETALAGVIAANDMLREDLERVRGMFKREDVGWEKLGTINGEEHGMTKEDLDDWSEEIREAIVGNTWIKAGIRLRNSYVLQGGGILYENIPDKADGRSRSRNVKECIANPVNQAAFFGMEARKRRETALYSDGNVFYLGDNTTFELEEIPMWEIDGDYRNPENNSQIWAFRRVWTVYVPGSATPVKKVAWYFTDTYKSKAIDRKTEKQISIIEHGGAKERVDPTKTMFDGRVNTQTGWAYGIPDAVVALIWARIFRDFMTNGKIMTDALAQFAFQATADSAKGATNVGLKVSRQGGAAKTVVTDTPNAFNVLSSAGKGYDFSSGVPLLAAVATAIGVSVIHLSADPGTAGGSYGSASTLDLPTMLATNDRRDWHIEFDLRVLRWMGAPDAHAYFKPLTSPTDVLRLIQAFVAMWNTGTYSSDEFRILVDELLGNKPGKAPKGVMLPNNEKFTQTLTNDGADPAATTAAGQATPTAKATGQGKATKAGKSPKGNDMRTDTLANSLRDAELSDRLEMALEALDRALERMAA